METTLHISKNVIQIVPILMLLKCFLYLKTTFFLILLPQHTCRYPECYQVDEKEDGCLKNISITIHQSIMVSYEVHSISFQNFLVWTLLLTVHTKNSSPLQRILLRHQCTCCTVPTTSGKPPGSLLV